MEKRSLGTIIAAWVSGRRGEAIFFATDRLYILKDGNNIPDFVLNEREIYTCKELVSGPDFIKMANVGLTLPVIKAVLRREVLKEVARKCKIAASRCKPGSKNHKLAMSMVLGLEQRLFNKSKTR